MKRQDDLLTWLQNSIDGNKELFKNKMNFYELAQGYINTNIAIFLFVEDRSFVLQNELSENC